MASVPPEVSKTLLLEPCPRPSTLVAGNTIPLALTARRHCLPSARSGTQPGYAPQGSLEAEVGFLSSTPILLRPLTPVSVDGDGSDWAGMSALAVDPSGDAPSEVYDLKALYGKRMNEQLYLMIEFATTKPQAEVHIFLDDRYFVDARFAPGVAATDLMAWPDKKDLGDIPLAYGKVLELAIPLDLIGKPERVKVYITCKDEKMNDMDVISDAQL